MHLICEHFLFLPVSYVIGTSSCMIWTYIENKVCKKWLDWVGRGDWTRCMCGRPSDVCSALRCVHRSKLVLEKWHTCFRPVECVRKVMSPLDCWWSHQSLLFRQLYYLKIIWGVTLHLCSRKPYKKMPERLLFLFIFRMLSHQTETEKPICRSCLDGHWMLLVNVLLLSTYW